MAAAVVIVASLTAAAMPPRDGARTGSAGQAAALPVVQINVSGQGTGASAPYSFGGWGTSLAWWAEAAGTWPQTQQTTLLQRLFGAPDISNPGKSLGLTIARYNIGASSLQSPPDPSQMPCPAGVLAFPKLVPVPQQGPFFPVALGRDSAQLGIFRQINSMIGSGEHQYEAFANSPPWWLLSSGSGGCPIGNSRLAEGDYGRYAQYLTDVLEAFHQQEHIDFATVDPFNEPWAPSFKWPNGCTSNCQEGANFEPFPPLPRDPTIPQQQIVRDLCDDLLNSPDLSTFVSAMDENTPDGTLSDYKSAGLSATCMSQVNTHGYGGPSQRTNVSQLATLPYPVWMSEYGNNGDTLLADGGLALARQIALDLQYMRPEAWVYWQAVEADSPGNWGLLANTNFPYAPPTGWPDNTQFSYTYRYYALAQYSPFIRPGDIILKATRPGVSQTFTVAAEDPANGRIVLVTTNCDGSNENVATSPACSSTTQDRTVQYNLGNLAVDGSTVRAWRTTQGSPLQQIDTSGMSLSGGVLTDPSQPAGSITTYVIQTPGLPPTGGPPGTQLSYTGPASADYHDPFTASATLTSGGSPVPGQTITFQLGNSGGTQSCQAATTASGSASCTLTPDQVPGPTTLTISGGGSWVNTPFTITREESAVAYTGPGHIANGVPAQLSAKLTEDGTAPIAGRTVTITLGSGTSAQSCTGTSDAAGTANCTISTVSQPLTDTATVPVTVSFAGDQYYLPSQGQASVRLEYYTGRAYGLSASIHAALVTISIPPTPDTGETRVAQASQTSTPCTASVSTVLVSASALCPSVTTHLAPGTSHATATVADVTVGVPGLPVVELSGVQATSTSTCTGTSGTTAVTVRVAGTPVTVPTAPNSGVDLPDGIKLIVNEQLPVPGADYGLTVNAAHLVLPAGLGEVVVASATSDAHNCS